MTPPELPGSWTVDERRAALLSFIRGEYAGGVLGEGVTSYPEGDTNNSTLHADCLALERDGLIRRHRMYATGSIVWIPVEP